METFSYKLSAIMTLKTVIFYTLIGLCVFTSTSGHELQITASGIKQRFANVNDTVTLKCVIKDDENTAVYNSTNVYFSLSGDPLDSTIVDSKTRELTVTSKKPECKTYYCKSPSAKATKVVCFGLRPSRIKDFKCISHNMQKLTCSWSFPQNVMEEDFKLYYKANDKMSKTCEIRTVGQTAKCVWASHTSPPYRLDINPLILQLDWSNVLGYYPQPYFNISHYSIVKPDSPNLLIVTDREPDKVLLKWTIPEGLSNTLRADLVYKIDYKIPKYNDTIYNVDTSGFRTVLQKGQVNNVNFTLLRLPYAHTEYNVRVFMKPVEASEEYWSDPSEISFMTASEIPTRPPEVPTGAFHQNDFTDKRIVYIYWKQLEDFEEAGANFKYRYVITGKNTSLSGLVDNKSFVRYENLSREAMHVTIRSENEIGSSLKGSSLYIPAVEDTNLQINYFTSYAYENGTYELSWNTLNPVDNYTLFWLQHESSRNCKGRIGYTIIEPNANKHLISLSNKCSYRFAISANKGPRSSGMVWTKCELTPNGVEMNAFPITFFEEKGNTSVKLTWTLDCIFRDGIITGYFIKYCPINAVSEICSAKSVYIDNSKDTSTVITNLLPFTKYKFEINANTINGLKKGNNTKIIETTQGVPSSPSKIEIVNVSNNSIIMKIQPPQYLNGPKNNIKYIIYNYNKEIDRQKYSETVTLKGLYSYQNYSITVKAYNENLKDFYSSATEPLIVQTKIGAPSRLHPKYENMKILSWHVPEHPGGNLDKYQIKIVTDGRTAPEDQLIIETNDLSYDATCSEEAKNITYQVRAVNIDRDTDPTTEFPGEWSTETYIYCNTISTKNIVMTIIGLFMFLPLAYVSTKYYIRRKEMADLGPPIFHPEMQLYWENAKCLNGKINNNNLLSMGNGISQPGKYGTKLKSTDKTDPLLVSRNNNNSDDLHKIQNTVNSCTNDVQKQIETDNKLKNNKPLLTLDGNTQLTKNAATGYIQPKDTQKTLGYNVNSKESNFDSNKGDSSSKLTIPQTTFGRVIQTILPMAYVRVGLNTDRTASSHPAEFVQTNSGYVTGMPNSAISVPSSYVPGPGSNKEAVMSKMPSGYVQAGIAPPSLPCRNGAQSAKIFPTDLDYVQSSSTNTPKIFNSGKPIVNATTGYVKAVPISNLDTNAKKVTFATLRNNDDYYPSKGTLTQDEISNKNSGYVQAVPLFVPEDKIPEKNNIAAFEGGDKFEISEKLHLTPNKNSGYVQAVPSFVAQDKSIFAPIEGSENFETLGKSFSSTDKTNESPGYVQLGLMATPISHTVNRVSASSIPQRLTPGVLNEANESPSSKSGYVSSLPRINMPFSTSGASIPEIESSADKFGSSSTLIGSIRSLNTLGYDDNSSILSSSNNGTLKANNGYVQSCDVLEKLINIRSSQVEPQIYKCVDKNDEVHAIARL